ncbi:cytochrome P450 [Nocardia sp. NBC_01327]|uniref:cytochrome P450 n=1 Tax=Nocardia sp. NBC_01327 TaxID=2903593 RepID=UPI002E121316|nr:cytochrome P450 [Nocardia sp. NBC_01327]
MTLAELPIFASAPVLLTDIPNLDPPPAYTPIAESSRGSLPQIVLPSGHTAVHVTRYRDVLAVLADPTFSRAVTNTDDGASFLPTTMPPELPLNLDVPDHARMKGYVTSDYSARSVAALESAATGILDDALSNLRRSEQPDLFGTVLNRIPVEVNMAFLGLPISDIDYFRPSSRVVQMAPESDVPGLLEHFWLVYDYLTDLVTGKREVLEGGLVARFIAGRDSVEPRLSDAELVGLLMGSLLGADHNVLSVLAKAVYVLLSAPPLWKWAVQNPDRTPELVEELLRVLPLGTISTFPRVATRDLPVGDGVIYEGDVVYADAFAANRDPSEYPDPHRIDPERKGPRHLQFGYGMHHCMGASLARMELTVVIRRLTSEYPGLRLAADSESLPWDSGVLLRRPTLLPVRW